MRVRDSAHGAREQRRLLHRLPCGQTQVASHRRGGAGSSGKLRTRRSNHGGFHGAVRHDEPHLGEFQVLGERPRQPVHDDLALQRPATGERGDYALRRAQDAAIFDRIRGTAGSTKHVRIDKHTS